MKFEQAKTLVLLAGAGYVVYKLYQAGRVVDDVAETISDSASTVNEARISTGQAIGNYIFDLTNLTNKMN